MKKYILALLMLVAASAKANPVIFAINIESGPKTGGVNNKGAFLTIYGVGFGASQGGSSATVGGGAVDNCPVWGTAWLWYQKITCQLGASVATGAVVVTVGGNASTQDPTFTVRAGSIYFVDCDNGDNSDDGSLASPWLTVPKAVGTIANGDIAYIRESTCDQIDGTDGASSVVMTGHSGASGTPKALVGYPGETANIGCVPPSSICYGISRRSGNSDYWTFSDFELSSNSGTQYLFDYEGGGTMNGLRLVGLKAHGSFGTAIVLQGPSNSSYLAANDIYDYWSVAHGAGAGERGYGIYYGGYGTQQGIRILYNRIRNTQGSSGYGSKGIQIYGHCPNDCPGIDDFFVDVVIDYNQVLDNCLEGIAVGGTDGGTNPWEGSGTTYIRNNLIAGNGWCAVIQDLTYSGIQLGDGFGGMVAKLWNNTFYLNGGGTIGNQGSGDILVFNKSNIGQSMDLQNNIFVASPITSTAYDTYVYLDESPGGSEVTTKTGTKNSFYANGNTNPSIILPAFVTSTVSEDDPLFVAPSMYTGTGNFHLQATSPAKTGGATIATTPDLDGCTRPQGATFGLGVFEYVVACSTGGGGTTYYFRGH